MSAEAAADPTRLAELTTLRLGGPATELVTARSEDALVEAVRDGDERGLPVLVLGGGSNLVVADAGFEGRVVQVLTRGVHADHDDRDDHAARDDRAAHQATCGGVTVTVAAGEPWDPFVALAVERGWVGVEALSGIPGSVGATPVQNVGAYGQEVSQTVARVRAWDRHESRVRSFSHAECRFSYRHSVFKAEPGRFVVLDVAFQLRQGTLGAPVTYTELARTLGVDPGRRAPLGAVREAVLGLRRGKGMVLDEADHDSWSAGSFFTNPVVEADRVPEGAPSWPLTGDPEGRVKTSAAWLIQHAGFERGHVTPGGSGAVSLSTKHTLALTNRGEGTATELLALAREVRDGVEDAFGIRLDNEPVLVGCTI